MVNLYCHQLKRFNANEVRTHGETGTRQREMCDVRYTRANDPQDLGVGIYNDPPHTKMRLSVPHTDVTTTVKIFRNKIFCTQLCGRASGDGSGDIHCISFLKSSHTFIFTLLFSLIFARCAKCKLSRAHSRAT